MAIQGKWIVNLKGKDYPLWAGVLDAATEAGLLGLETEVVQFPTAENDHLAVVMATATFAGPDGRDRVFTDVGDCSPKSTAPHLVAASLRIASTRAKGRACRDGINVGQTMYEELPNEEFEESPKAGGVRESGATGAAEAHRRPPAGAPPAAPLPVARHAPVPLGQPSAPRSETPRPVVVAESGAPVCELCGVVLTTAQMQISEKHFSGRRLCPNDQRNERVALGIRAQSTEAPA